MQVTGGGAIRLTTALYFTPSGRSIQKEGIKPDIEVEPAKIENLAARAGFREENLRRSITNPNAKPADATGRRPRGWARTCGWTTTTSTAWTP